MIDQATRSKIKKLKIQTKRIVHSALSGDYLSAFKGSGLEFNQIREYHMGDDVRAIDWNSSAKMNKIMIKQFIEERDRTVILAVDISASGQYSSKSSLRTEAITQLAATLAFIANNNKDKVGALFFSDTIEKWIPPSKGNVHLGSIIETLFTIKPHGRKTDIAQALRFLIGRKKRNAIVFMISDWIDEAVNFQNVLKVASCEYDFVGIRILDDCERQFPNIGLIEIQDPETGAIMMLDSGNSKQCATLLKNFLHQRCNQQKRMFEKFRIDLLDLTIGHSIVQPLAQFFHQRIRRQI